MTSADGRPIRVMRIIARLNVGGPAIHVTLLTERLGPPEFESSLVAGRVGPNEGDMSYLARERGITPIEIEALGRELSPLADVRTLFQLVRLMRRARPDVVHTHTAKAGFVGRTAAWLARVPVRVHTYHGHVLSGYFGPAKTRLFIGLERLVGRLSTRLITISPSLRDELVDSYRIATRDRFVVVPLGLELDRFAAGAPRGTLRALFAIPPDAPLVGIVGRLVPIKNHALFLDMASLVHAQRPHVRFVIVGDGELRHELEASVTDHGLADVVHFAGWYNDLVPVYADLDTVVISSDNEGTPVSILEALASGVSVVSTSVGGVPDLLEGGRLGRLTPKGDAGALAAATLAAIDERDDSLRRQWSGAVVEAYGIDRLTRDLAALYRELLREQGRLTPSECASS